MGEGAERDGGFVQSSEDETSFREKKIKKVEVCVSNLSLGSDEVLRRVEQYFPEVKVYRWGCLGYCHLCFQKPAVLIDDETYIQGETPEDLWEQVKALLQSS